MGGVKEAAQWSEGARAADGRCPGGSRDPHGDAGGTVVSGAADACEHIAEHQPKFMLLTPFQANTRMRTPQGTKPNALYQIKPSDASDTNAGQDKQGNTTGDQDALVIPGEAK
jgi:hypothetical protein